MTARIKMPFGETWMVAYFAEVDRMNPVALVSWYAPGGSFRFANHPPVIGHEAAKYALAKAFCDLATKRGENIHAGLVNELSLCGTEETLNGLIDADEMTDLQSFVKARVSVPSLG